MSVEEILKIKIKAKTFPEGAKVVIRFNPQERDFLLAVQEELQLPTFEDLIRQLMVWTEHGLVSELLYRQCKKEEEKGGNEK